MADQPADRPGSSNGKLTFVISLSSDHTTPSRRKQELQNSLIRSQAASIGHRRKKAKKAQHSITRLRRISQASRGLPIKQPDYSPQWHTTLYRPPLSQGFQVINPFDDALNIPNGRDIYQLVQFYHTWTRTPESMLMVAFQHKICLYALTAYSAVVLRRLGLMQLPESTELGIRSTALSAMRSYLNSPTFEPEAVLHALVCFCIGSIERGEIIETRIHLEAIAGIIGRKGIAGLPQYLQQIISYCDMSAAVPSLSPTIFDFQCLSIDKIQGNVPDEPSLSPIAVKINDELTTAQAPPIYLAYAKQLTVFAMILLHSHDCSASGSNVPTVYHQGYRMVSSCLATLEDADPCLPSGQLCRRLTLIIILWRLALSAPISGCEYYSMFTEETISSFDSLATQVNLRQWNAAMLSLRTKSVTDQYTIINQLSRIVCSEVERDFPSIGAFIHQYCRLSLERSASHRGLTQEGQSEGITLRQQLLGPIIARWPIFAAI